MLMHDKILDGDHSSVTLTYISMSQIASWILSYDDNKLHNKILDGIHSSNQIKFYLKSAMYIWKKRKLARSYLPDNII